MSDSYFGLVELLFVFGVCIALYIWQRRSLNRDIQARKDREAQERARTGADDR